MQNKGAIRIFAILLGLACLFYLSFSWITRKVETQARESADRIATKTEIVEAAKKKADGNANLEKALLDTVRMKVQNNFLDSVRKLPVDFPVYGSWLKFTYEDCKEHEVNLGLDLKGGMNVTLEVSVPDIIKNMSSKPNDDKKLNQALGQARVREYKEKKHFAEIFAEELRKVDPGASLSSYFRSNEMKGKIDFNTTDDEVVKLIKERVDEAIATSEKTLRARIDKFGVTQPNIQKLAAAGRILIELPGVSDKERVRKLLQGTANLELWETYTSEEAYNKIAAADKRLSEILAAENLGDTTSAKKDSASAKNADAKKEEASKKDSAKKDSTSLLSKLGTEKKDSSKNAVSAKSNKDSLELAKAKQKNPLFILLNPFFDPQKGVGLEQPIVGIAHIKDTAKIMSYLNDERIKRVLPDDMKFAWSYKVPLYFKNERKYEDIRGLIPLKVTRRDKKAALSGDIITDARKEYEQKGGGTPHISVDMTDDAAQTWAAITEENAPHGNTPGRNIAIVLDGIAYSYPFVQGKIPGGHTQITGSFTSREADDLVNILKAGKLPAPARIVEETIVGPTLGTANINAGFKSFVIAILLVFVFMIFWYSKAGIVSDIVLLINTFFIIGVLASLGAVLTLPGIAGIVLVVAISVDANVLIYERIREEIRGGKGIQLAVADGYKHAMSSILDSNITTLLLGIILYAYGSGPVQGFATTLIIGILCSLFSAIFISRLVFETLLGRKMDVTFSIPFSANVFKNANFDFVKRRRTYYIFSSAIILLGIVFFFKHHGFTMGVDFKGGRSYYVRFEKPVETETVGEALRKSFGVHPEVKTFGGSEEVRITTSYMIDDTSSTAEQQVEQKLNTGLSSLNNQYKIMQSQKVGETISRDLRNNAVWTILFSCALMFIYILIRFKGWQYGLGATVALFHDVLVVLSCYAIFDGIVPFTLEINQDFIAAILTVMGYSMTDTVVVFDRIREYLNEKGKVALIPGEEKNRIINYALNSTLSRTMITSLITFFVLVAIFFFGGEVIRSFAFALLIGIIIGTYSSICIATPIVIDFDRKKKETA